MMTMLALLRLAIAATILGNVTLVAAAETLEPGPGDHTRTLVHDGRQRSYLVHLPTNYHGSRPLPVVLLFHGGGSNARQFLRFTGFNATADQHGFIAVYPNGTGKTNQGYEILGWNGGPRQPGGTNSEISRVDDVGFTRALLDDLARIARIDEKRVYAAGMSMGAIMAYRLASELSDQIAAIAAVAGPMTSIGRAAGSPGDDGGGPFFRSSPRPSTRTTTIATAITPTVTGTSGDERSLMAVPPGSMWPLRNCPEPGRSA